MAKRRKSGNDSVEVLARLIALLTLLGGPAVAAFFRDRPWALPLAAGTVVFGLVGLTMFAVALRQMRRQAAARRLLLEQDWARLSDKEFEHYVAGVFRAQGWQAQVVGGTADGGVDIEMHRNGHNAVVQVKQYLSGRKVNVKEVREFSAVLARAGANEGYFVTAGQFSQPAVAWAKAEPMTLVSGGDLAQWAEETRQDIAAQPAQSGFNLVQWLTLAFLVATACGVFSFVAGLLIGG